MWLGQFDRFLREFDRLLDRFLGKFGRLVRFPGEILTGLCRVTAGGGSNEHILGAGERVWWAGVLSSIFVFTWVCILFEAVYTLFGLLVKGHTEINVWRVISRHILFLAGGSFCHPPWPLIYVLPGTTTVL